MNFVGTCSENTKHVEQYTPEMLTILLLSASVTSEASIEYKDEERLLADAKNADKTYVEVVLPQKMWWNLQSLKDFSFVGDIKTMFKTVWAVVR